MTHSVSKERALPVYVTCATFQKTDTSRHLSGQGSNACGAAHRPAGCVCGVCGSLPPTQTPPPRTPRASAGSHGPGGRPRPAGTVRPSAALACTLLFFLLPPVCGAHEVKFFLLFETRHFEQTQALSISLHWGFPNL